MAAAALMDSGLPAELVDKIMKEKAALTIQSFVRRSVWRILVESSDVYSSGFSTRHVPKNQIHHPITGGIWHPLNFEHQQYNSFEQYAPAVDGKHYRKLHHRYKPLNIVLKQMIKILVDLRHWHTLML